VAACVELPVNPVREFVKETAAETADADSHSAINGTRRMLREKDKRTLFSRVHKESRSAAVSKLLPIMIIVGCSLRSID
jgi:hypothetical protein